MGNESLRQTPETLSGKELARGYLRGEIEGPRLMDALLERLDLQDAADTVLTRKDGTTVASNEGEPLTARDYMQVASKHGNAVQALLGFMTLTEDHPRYVPLKTQITKIVEGYLPADQA